MKSRFLAAFLGILAAGGIGVSAAFLTRTPPAAVDTPQSSVQISPSSQRPIPVPDDESASESAVVYTIKDYEGQLAIFVNDSTVPDMTFDVYTRHLPEYDQKKLTQGIKVEGYDKLMELIEDYIS